MISLVLVFIEYQILYHGEQIDKDCVDTFILKIISNDQCDKHFDNRRDDQCDEYFDDCDYQLNLAHI